MDIVKGNLDNISRPTSVSRSRPGNRISSSLQADKTNNFSTVCSLEVLTPEICLSEKLTFDDGGETLNAQSPESSPKDQSLQSHTMISLNSEQERVNENLESEETKDSDSSEVPVGAEQNFDPKLEKAMKKMKALDEILLKRIAKEKEVVAQSNALRKELWEELQSVSKHLSPRSHEENVNTNMFLALTSRSDNAAVLGNSVHHPAFGDGPPVLPAPASGRSPRHQVVFGNIRIQRRPQSKLAALQGETSVFEKTFLPVFSTQLPLEECDDDGELKSMDGKSSGMETSESLHQKTKQKKCKDHKTRLDFIQRNIELVKEAGSYVHFMDDEKLRLEQLLADIQDGCSDDEVTTDSSLWLVPGEGYTPEPNELEQLATIEEQLKMFSSTTETNDCDHGALHKHSDSEVSLDKSGNSVPAPGEQVLRYTKELREQKIRLKEIDQQLDDIEQTSTTPLSMSRLQSSLSESSLNIL